MYQIGALREREIAAVRTASCVVIPSLLSACLSDWPSIARAALFALMTLIPVLASILSFVRVFFLVTRDERTG